MPWKRILAVVTGEIEESLLAKVEYLIEENRVLRNQHPSERRFQGMVGEAGLEPASLSAQDPKSCVSANSTTRPPEGGVSQRTEKFLEAIHALLDGTHTARIGQAYVRIRAEGRPRYDGYPGFLEQTLREVYGAHAPP